MSLKDHCTMIMTAAEIENREAWLKVRNDSIGGSEAAAIVGVNPWKSEYTLWLEKTGQSQQEDISENECVHFGTILEQVVADEFCRREGKKVRKCGLFRSNKYPFMTASFDRLLVGEDAGLECKTSNAFMRGPWDEGDIPPNYYVQCQHYMLVSGFPRWYIACLIGGNHFVSWVVERNDDDIAALEQMEFAFWDKVQHHIMPEVDGSESSTDSLKKMYKGGNNEPIVLPQESMDLLKRLDELKALKSDIDFQTKDIQNKLCAMLGDNEIGIIGEGDNERKVTWKTVNGRVTIDSKKLKKDLPDVFEKYSKKSADSRRFSA
ncbi:YqaJ viral recombinase family protein [Selenomonas ruminantium]|uniref:YqaJ viral recombinase family nuclease n=1 Tax=Selenomonas ruminantium TaxID=971 RepID=UPI0004072556|nr:YqaJ viral recombinase family protein [Selenomonas ruminantium]